jgi:hypothetical protein
MDALVDATPKRQALIVTTIPATIADTQQPGFFILSQSGERPERYVESFRFDTMPLPKLTGMAEYDLAVLVLLH